MSEAAGRHGRVNGLLPPVPEQRNVLEEDHCLGIADLAALDHGDCLGKRQLEHLDILALMRRAAPCQYFNYGKNLSFGRDCTGSLQGVAGIRAMYDAVARCIGG